MIKYIEADRGGKQGIKHEKEAVYNWNKSRETFGNDYEFVIF